MLSDCTAAVTWCLLMPCLPDSRCCAIADGDLNVFGQTKQLTVCFLYESFTLCTAALCYTMLPMVKTRSERNGVHTALSPSTVPKLRLHRGHPCLRSAICAGESRRCFRKSLTLLDRKFNFSNGLPGSTNQRFRTCVGTRHRSMDRMDAFSHCNDHVTQVRRRIYGLGTVRIGKSS